jgi:phosphoenolpyruvate synthase/pyruvate phosphate dikinase
MQISMPGMMDTVLNLGLNDDVVKGLAAKAGERYAYDCYRRFLDMYGNVVLGFDHHDFEKELTALKVPILSSYIRMHARMCFGLPVLALTYLFFLSRVLCM